jgi:hypothetical protein
VCSATRENCGLSFSPSYQTVNDHRNNMVTFPHAGTHFKLWRFKKNRRWGSWASGRHNFTKKKWHGECRDIITQVEIFFSFLFPQTDVVMRTNEVSQSSLRITCWGYIAPEKGNCGNWSHSDDDEQGASGSSPFCLFSLWRIDYHRS